MLQLFWLAVIAIAVLGGVLVLLQWWQTALPTAGTRRSLPQERTIFDLQIGDIVQYLGTDWVVEERLTYNEQGFIWMEYLVQEGDQMGWLSVEEDDRVEVYWMEPVKGLEIASTPPKQLTVAGQLYQQVESGTARMTRQGTTLNRQAERCHYYDYEGPGDRVLSIEDWGGEMEVTAGQRIRPTALTILPGDGHRVYGV